VSTRWRVRIARVAAAEAPGTLWERLRGWLKDGRTWLTMLYMILELPLGVAYFTIAVTALSLSIALFAAPFWAILAGALWPGDPGVYPHVMIGDWPLPVW